MAVLLDLREQLDMIDKQIVELYEKRMEISEQVAIAKLEMGKAVFDKQREEEKLASVRDLCSKEANKDGIQRLYEHIMDMSKEVQYQIIDNEKKEKI